MAPLKSLEQVWPIIDTNFQNFCALHGIFSVEDFLIQDLYVLAAFAEQNPTSDKLKQGITQILSIIDAERQPWMNGLEVFHDVVENKHVLSTGCEGVDALLGNGLREGQLVEIVGPSSSGKTQVCLQAASNVATKYNAKVLYLDTGNSFSPQRILGFVNWKLGAALDGPLLRNMANQQFGAFNNSNNSGWQQLKPFNNTNNSLQHLILLNLQQSSNMMVHLLSGKSMLQQVMSSISCHSVFDIFAMFDVLHQLEFTLRSQMCKGHRRVQLLIVDSISSLITPILGGTSSQGHALMISAGSLLKKIAHEYNIAVLVTNHTVGGDRGTSKPALGESWKSVPHVRLQLSRDPGINVCQASILKHSSMASGMTARFVIYE